MIRKPAVAGSFYPADKNELSDLIEKLLGRAEVVVSECDLKILIVPHAGLEYSGRTAAWGFKQIQGKDYTRVILLGVSHQSCFDYAAIYDEGNWETPLGSVNIDESLVKSLLTENIVADEESHQQEHSLEIELIFLQKTLEDFKIVPILLGQVSEKVVDDLAQKISQTLDEKTLLVVSSDLSHYPSWSVANEVDAQTIKAVISGSPEKFVDTINSLERKGYPNLDTCACGQQAISVALKVAEILSIKDLRKIKYENSGGLPAEALAKAGDKSRVVGYAAIGIWKEKGFARENDLVDEKAQKEALKIARKTLEEYLNREDISHISLMSHISPVLGKPLGCFVTLRNKGRLRGCIGLFEPKKLLYQVIQEMAVAAATKDSRFLPVTASELKDISIEISVMTPKKKINDWRKIELGKHGVVVQKGFRCGTFLPQVATETGWTKEEFLNQLCVQKAGLPADCFKDPLVNLFIFEAQVFEEK